MSDYEQACRRIAALRGSVGPGSQVFVDVKIGAHRGAYPAKVVRRLTSGRYLLAVTAFGKSYRVSVDPARVAHEASILRQRKALA